MRVDKLKINNGLNPDTITSNRTNIDDDDDDDNSGLFTKLTMPPNDFDNFFTHKNMFIDCETNQIECDTNDPNACKTCGSGDNINNFYVCVKTDVPHAIGKNGICGSILYDRNDRSCSTEYGDWVLSNGGGMNRVKTQFNYYCKCKNPNIVRNSSNFSDCNIPVSCGPHGRLVGDQCVCDGNHLIADIVNGIPSCRLRMWNENELLKPIAGQRINNSSSSSNTHHCPEGFILIKNHEKHFSNDFVQKFSNLNTCIPNPCQWDPTTQSFLGRNSIISREIKSIISNNTPLIQNYCFCNADYGSFGVHVPDRDKMFKFDKFSTDGGHGGINVDLNKYPNMCMNIYKNELTHKQYPLSTCHFYDKNIPQCTLFYSMNTDNKINPAILNGLDEESDNLGVLVRDEWPYDYFNRSLETFGDGAAYSTKMSIDASKREEFIHYDRIKFPASKMCVDAVTTDDRRLVTFHPFHANVSLNNYNLTCISEDETFGDIYRGKYILNPAIPALVDIDSVKDYSGITLQKISGQNGAGNDDEMVILDTIKKFAPSPFISKYVPSK